MEELQFQGITFRVIPREVLNRPIGSYAVSKCGKVLSMATRTHKLLKQSVSNMGFCQTSAGMVHALVAECWLEEKKPHKLARLYHIDRDKMNNHVDNIHWDEWMIADTKKKVGLGNKEYWAKKKQEQILLVNNLV